MELVDRFHDVWQHVSNMDPPLHRHSDTPMWPVTNVVPYVYFDTARFPEYGETFGCTIILSIAKLIATNFTEMRHDVAVELCSSSRLAL